MSNADACGKFGWWKCKQISGESVNGKRIRLWKRLDGKNVNKTISLAGRRKNNWPLPQELSIKNLFSKYLLSNCRLFENFNYFSPYLGYFFPYWLKKNGVSEIHTSLDVVDKLIIIKKFQKRVNNYLWSNIQIIFMKNAMIKCWPNWENLERS